jgi:hypothetical protein
MKGHADVVSAIRENDEIFLNAIVIGELIAGFIKSTRRRKNERELRTFLGSARVGTLDITEPQMECLLALCDLAEGYGQPHVHSGLGIRKLGDKLFECRGNRSLRFIFQNRGSEFFVSLLGAHDAIRTLLRRGTYR